MPTSAKRLDQRSDRYLRYIVVGPPGASPFSVEGAADGGCRPCAARTDLRERHFHGYALPHAGPVRFIARRVRRQECRLRPRRSPVVVV
jgi:hypothetical protein